MPDYTLEEARDQARKATAYFGEVAKLRGKGVVAVRNADTILLAAQGKNAREISDLLTANGWAFEDITSDG